MIGYPSTKWIMLPGR